MARRQRDGGVGSPKTPRPERRPDQPVAHTCAQCREVFYARPPKRGKRPQEVCGRTLCWALHYWTTEEWAGRKRMAEALAATWAEVTGPDQLVAYRPRPTSAALKSTDGGSSLDTTPRWCLPGWSDLDEEAMRRG